MQLQEDFPALKVIKLEQNYRSTKNILETASGLISNNNSRVGKKLWSSETSGELVKLNCYSSGKDAKMRKFQCVPKHLQYLCPK